MGTYWRGSTRGRTRRRAWSDVKLLPLPAGVCNGAGTPTDPAVCVGQLAITLRPGTPFVLPLAVWTVERYIGYPTIPDDPAIPDDAFLEGVTPSLSIDGKRDCFRFEQGGLLCLVHRVQSDRRIPDANLLRLGRRASVPRLRHREPTAVRRNACDQALRAVHLESPVSLGVIYDNTWIVTVTPH